MLTLENISFGFGNDILFQNISFSILPGSCIVIKGPNGSGKTTLMQVIAGLKKPKTGKVRWNNVDISKDYQTYYQYCVSYLGIKHALKMDLSIFENLLFWAEIKNHRELILPSLRHFNLLNEAETNAVNLSSGMLKKTMLARLIICNNDLWLLDEPDSFLDQEAKEALQRLITVKTREGGTVILTSHNIDSFQKTATISIEEYK